ncbi:hypothetical protein RIF29_31270 [Crotalaria pallida]|uniref:Uncharacterized protein n=1 Tax=Crotalaria pallida TaxID=3830 RepID=A0AAN9EMA2_CROPI
MHGRIFPLHLVHKRKFISNFLCVSIESFLCNKKTNLFLIPKEKILLTEKSDILHDKQKRKLRKCLLVTNSTLHHFFFP